MDYQKLDQARRIYRNFLLGVIVLSILAIVIGLISFNLNGTISVILIALTIILAIASAVLAILSWFRKRTFRLAYKQYFVWRSLANAFTDLQYNPESGLPESTIAATGMLYMGDRYRANDFVSGRYKGVGFAQSDIHTEEREETTDPEGHRQVRYHTLFKGRWMIFEFPKKFDFDLQIVQKGFRNKAFRLFTASGERKFVKMELESPEFNQNFDLYAQDGFEVFYLLTPDVIEKIQALGTQCGGKIMLGFIDRQLHIAIDNKQDAFEPSNCFKRIDEQVELTKISKDIGLITMLVDALLAPKTPPQTNA